MFVLLDTNHFQELREGGDAAFRLRDRLDSQKPDVFTCIVVAEEVLQGWIALIRRKTAGADQLDAYARLQSSIDALQKIAVLPFDEDAARIFHRLQDERIRVGTMDLKIAAICLAHDALLLTRNRLDFEKVPGLRVENWLD